MYNFELREITRFYSQIKAAVYEPTHDSENMILCFLMVKVDKLS